jgi:DNA-binding transcriptional LysR family regulator
VMMDFENSPTLAPDLELVHLLDDPYDAVLPEGHPLAEQKTVDLTALAKERFIVHPPGMGCREGTIAACNAVGFDPEIAIECDENEQVQAFVGARLGVAIYPRLALSTLRQGVVVREVRRGAIKRRVYAATLAGGYRSPAAEAMLEILRDAAEEFAESRPLAAA